MRKTVYIVISIIIGIAIGFGTFYVFNRNEPDQPTNTSQPSSEQQPTNEPAKQPTTYPVSVYFSKHPESDNDPSKTFTVQRASPDLSVAKFSITELLKGPTPDEQSKGYFTYVRLRDDTSNCGGADFIVSIENGVATLQFCKTFDHIGSVSDGQAESNIKDTLKQFPTVQKIVILNKSGKCEFDLSGLNLCLQ